MQHIIVKVFYLMLLERLLVTCEFQNDNELKFNVYVSKDGNLMCDQGHTNQSIFTTLEHETLKIKFNYNPEDTFEYPKDKKIIVTECTYDKGEPLYDKKKIIGPGTVNVTVKKVTAAMNSIWTCTVAGCANCMGPNISDIYVRNNGKTETLQLAQTTCSRSVHVRLIESPMRITVNRTIINTPRNDWSVTDIDYDGVYFYTDGEYIEVFCSKSPGHRGLLSLNYSNRKTLKRSGDVAGISELGFGFKITLQSRDNNSYLLCTFKQITDKRQTVTRVRFINTDHTQDFITVKVGKTTIRPHKNEDNEIKIYHEYNINEIFSVHFETNPQFVSSDTKYDNAIQPKTCVKFKNQNEDELEYCKHVSFQITENCSNETVVIKCTATLNTGGKLHVELNFVKEAENRNKDICLLEVNGLDQNNIDIIYYHPPLFQKIDYNYCTGDRLTVFCHNKFCDPNIDTKPSLTWRGASYKNLTITEPLTDEHQGSVINCSVVEYDDGKPVKSLRNITITLHHITSTVTSNTQPTENNDGTLDTSPTDDKATSNPSTTNDNGSTPDPNVDNPGQELIFWICVSVGIFTCLVIVCVVTIICRMKRRVKEQKPTNYKNLSAQSEASIPAYPSQWEGNYAVPSDVRSESPKYNVPTGSDEAVYTVPIPKSQRNPKPYEVTYAHLDNTFLSRRRGNKIQEKDDPTYAEVSCYANINQEKTSQTTYDNVFDGTQYVNSNDTEYIEPTYCEAIKHRR